MNGSEKVMWSVYWTKMKDGTIISPPTRDMTYTYADINECFRKLALNIEETEWEGHVDECKY